MQQQVGPRLKKLPAVIRAQKSIDNAIENM